MKRLVSRSIVTVLVGAVVVLSVLCCCTAKAAHGFVAVQKAVSAMPACHKAKNTTTDHTDCCSSLAHLADGIVTLPFFLPAPVALAWMLAVVAAVIFPRFSSLRLAYTGPPPDSGQAPLFIRYASLRL